MSRQFYKDSFKNLSKIRNKILRRFSFGRLIKFENLKKKQEISESCFYKQILSKAFQTLSKNNQEKKLQKKSLEKILINIHSKNRLLRKNFLKKLKFVANESIKNEKKAQNLLFKRRVYQMIRM